MARQFTLGKDERLKSRKAIEQLFKGGKSFVAAPLRIYYLANREKGLQFGVGVSSKNFKRAVDRNRIKRLTKEAWRLQKNVLNEKIKEKNIGLNIFFIYTGKELPDYKVVSDKVQQAIKKLLKLTDENIASNS